MKQFLLGNSPISSLAGYLLAGLYAFQTSFKPEMKWYDWAVPVAIAILGRVVGDSQKKD